MKYEGDIGLNGGRAGADEPHAKATFRKVVPFCSSIGMPITWLDASHHQRKKSQG